MARRRRKQKESIKSKKIIRCKQKMKPVFETETCDDFKNKDSHSTKKICIQCKNSF